MTIICSQEEMEQRLVRYHELKPCTTAFIDTRTPGKQKENFTIIGPGVAENPDQYVHIDIPHGFNIGGVRQEPHCINSQHSHETAEVFIVQNSRWVFRCGVDASDGEIVLESGDVISIPTNVFRGFENIGEEQGYMCSVLGGDDPGKVTWAPAVFDMANDYGLILLENGQLVDTTKGETIPDGSLPMPPTTQEVVNSMRNLSLEEMHGCVCTAKDLIALKSSALAKVEGIEELPIIGDANPAEGISAGKMTWQHGFHLRCLIMAPSSTIDAHHRLEEEVIYLYEGDLDVVWQDGSLALGKGDVLTIPKQLNRTFHNSSKTTIAYVVRGGDNPAAPQWVS